MAKLLILIVLAGAVWWFWTNGQRRAASADVREAARLLNLHPDASREAILAAHRSLIERVHPDTGGSPALAAKVNRARDTMLAALDQQPPLR